MNYKMFSKLMTNNNQLNKIVNGFKLDEFSKYMGYRNKCISIIDEKTLRKRIIDANKKLNKID